MNSSNYNSNKYLAEAVYWIMDGTFNMMPTLFLQLYPTYVDIETTDNAKTLLLLYKGCLHKSTRFSFFNKTYHLFKKC